LFYARSVATTVPYVHGMLRGGELRNGAIEYPVLTGVFMYASAHLGLLPFVSRANSSNSNEYLYDSALLLAPFALLSAYLLTLMAGRRALLWAVAPALVLYAFHNWDLLAVAASVGGFWCWHRERPGWAAFWFGIGGALKLYPFIFLAPLILERVSERDRKGAGKALLAGVVAPALINLPFILIDRSGWFATYAFHELRWADYNSIWAWFSGARFVGLVMPSFSVAMINTLSAGLTGAFMLMALLFGGLQARREGTYPFLQVCGAMLAAFLLWNKVHSPQYALWILPFFVLLDVRIRWWIAYTVADLAVYIGIFRWFFDFVYKNNDFTWAKRLLIAGVWSRALLLLALFAIFLLARVSVGVRGLKPGTRTLMVASHPPANVHGVGVRLPD
jgi:uncharacterized membrane protein